MDTQTLQNKKTTISEPDIWRDQPSLESLTRQDIWKLRRAFLERLWPDVTNWKVLEVGSGPAHDSITFAQRKARVTAIDFSHIALTLSQKFYRELGLAVTPIRADAQALPFKTGSFDLAFNAGVLEHFTDENLKIIIDEMVRVVRPGGKVLVFCPNRYNIFYQHHLKKMSKIHRYEFERAFSADETRKWFHAHGLTGIQVDGVHVHPAFNYLLPSFLPKHHRIEPIMRQCFAPLENTNRLRRFKSIIGQDYVVWGTVPETQPVPKGPSAP